VRQVYVLRPRTEMSRLDPHSFNDDQQPSVEHFDWRAQVDFATRRLNASVTLRLATPGEGPLDLDTRGLEIQAVTGEDGRPLAHQLAAPEPILGARLRVTLPPATRQLSIRYRTAPDASALQWLEPAQTAGGQKPYLFSQCQAIHARSVVPLQDTPRIRVRYRAELELPPGLQGVMAARALGPTTFEMPQPIPPYLFAFAVGDLASRELGPRSRVWAEPPVPT